MPSPQNIGVQNGTLTSAASQIANLLDEKGGFNPEKRVSRDQVDKEVSRGDQGRFSRVKTQKEHSSSDEGSHKEVSLEEEKQNLPVQATGETSEEESVEPEEGMSDGDEVPTETTETEGEKPIETLSELASAVDMDEETFKAAIKHSFKADGEELTVTLAELEKGYQKDANYRRNTAKLAEERRALEAENQQRRAGWEQQQHLLAQQLSLTEQMIAAELASPKMAQLRESDPAEWTARQNEIGQRIGVLQQTRNQAAAYYDQYRLHTFNEVLQREQKALAERVPDWSDNHRGLARNVLSSWGFTDGEISSVVDSRVVLAALEVASMRDKVSKASAQEAKAKDAVKRIKKDIPKLAQPGKLQRSSNAVGRDAIKQLHGRLKKSGKLEDAASIIEQLI